jgi:hypothetical protein
MLLLTVFNITRFQNRILDSVISSSNITCKSSESSIMGTRYYMFTYEDNKTYRFDIDQKRFDNLNVPISK